jgi:hypothetical protein
MMGTFKVEPVDFIARNTCRMCGAHRTFHLATTDHTFVPGDVTVVEVAADELRPGDIIASIIPKQRTASSFEIYRRR